MTAPVVADQETSGGASGTSLGVDMPATVVAAGDLLLVVICAGNVTVTGPGGWTMAAEYTVAGIVFQVWWTVAAGGEEGDTVTWTASGSTPWAAVASLITGAETTSTGVAVSSSANGAVATPTPPEVEAWWPPGDTLYLSTVGWRDDDATVTAYPALYPHGQASTVSGGGTNAGAGAGVAARRLEAGSDTPGAWTLSESETWATFTVAVRPAVPPAPASVTTTGHVETAIRVDGAWREITPTPYARDPISIKHGRGDWASQAESSQIRMTVDDRAGTWSPDHATATWPLSRGDQVRVGVPVGTPWLEWTGGPTQDVASTPDDASLDITGDIDVRFQIRPHTVPPDVAVTNSAADQERILDKIGPTGTGWRVVYQTVNREPLLSFTWTEAALLSATVFASVGDRCGSMFAARVTLDVSTGACEWFFSDDGTIDGTWVSAGVTTVGATDIGTNDAPLVIGGKDAATVTTSPFRGEIHAVQIRDGIDGTVVASPDFSAQTVGATSFTDAAGLDWTVGDGGRITSTRWRAHGELASLPSQWSLDGADGWMPIQADGILRRLRAGTAALVDSPLRRSYDRRVLTSSAALVGYWPMEETGGETLAVMGPAVGGSYLVRRSGTPNPASSEVFLASSRLPTLADDVWVTNVDPAPPGEWMVRWCWHAPASLTADVDMLTVWTGDLRWRILYLGASGGGVQIDTYRQGAVVTTSPIAFTLADTAVRFSLRVVQDGTAVDWTIETVEQGATSSGGSSGTVAGSAASSPTVLWINQGGGCDGATFGHLAVESTARAAADMIDELTAHAGEPAGERVIRLLSEEGIPCQIIGDPAGTERLGPQTPGTLIDLLTEAADTDLGVLYDPPELVGVGYRTGASMRGQTPGWSLDYDGGAPTGTPTLERDDSRVTNDVTVTNWDGSTGRAVLDDGSAMSISEPPTGAGRIPAGYDAALYDPGRLPDHAHTRLALGVDTSPRLTGLAVLLHGVDAATRAAVLGLRPGDLIAVTDLHATARTDDLDQLVQGWTERIGTHTHDLSFNTTSARPWQTGTVEGDGTDGPVARYDTAGSILASGVEAGATSLLIATTTGPIWTTDSGDLPLDIAVDGVRLTVTAITGSSSPQTFTVGAVPRYLPGGSDVRLADPTTWSL